ncbi:TraB/GumN family protein [Spirosoma taeanense]|uniref:TraB/GumN family protein n=1 Tax=Spirosoma taeanense TaxID=2735870 RepID=A0A6M5Y5S9_9BACT|nr:TraB/GumN family protein [Spirosoma taeanense]QJW89165.1 TraB/GumN family protein [Spirosoma taeanense]
MKNLITAALLLIGLGTSGTSAQDKALLYKVTGPGLDKPSYLYGTFHLVCPDDLRITDALKNAIGDAQQVYLELDMDDPALMGQMMKSVMMTDGKTLKTLLKPEEYELLDGYLKKTMNTGLAPFNTMKPLYLMSLLYTTLLPCQPQPYDVVFAQMAANDKKEVRGLESLEAEMAALDKIPLREQLSALVDMARKPDEAKKEFTALLDAYKAHDLTKLMQLTKDSQFSGGDFSQFEDSLLGERNANWIPVIEKAAKEKPTFFAFGAGHLGTGKGIINLLRQKGYTVTPIQ